MSKNRGHSGKHDREQRQSGRTYEDWPGRRARSYEEFRQKCDEVRERLEAERKVRRQINEAVTAELQSRGEDSMPRKVVSQNAKRLWDWVETFRRLTGTEPTYDDAQKGRVFPEGSEKSRKLPKLNIKRSTISKLAKELRVARYAVPPRWAQGRKKTGKHDTGNQ